MKFKLFPKDQTFNRLFTEQVDMIAQASQLFLKLSKAWPAPEMVAEMVELEDRGDKHTRALIAHLNKSFITPMDREDIYGIAVLMDEILDLFQSVTVRMKLYEMQVAVPAISQMGDILVRCSEVLREAVTGLTKMEDVSAFFNSMQSLENEADDVNREALAQLYRDCKSLEDMIYLSKFQEVISRLEDTADKFKRMFELLQQVIIKHA